ncbi:hypothetical protein N657DRAFT_655554 [Parathielavia appendiculata]|uniref:Uncharacterized protein n=1 Tax=Parathielavia appendiculata TaxID=2587402 RepID=A0AAN6U1T5_9PEZI|nr:hypothetical protein N657DRAFT_655554 [Parathielavia appendiculata]
MVLIPSTAILYHRLGSNNIKAPSRINGTSTWLQNAAKNGTDQSFQDDTVRSARSRLYPSIPDVDQSVDQSVDHSKPRMHRGAGTASRGAAIATEAEVTRHLTKTATENEKANNSTTNTATTQAAVVTGVECRTASSNSTNALHGFVVFATSGFGGDNVQIHPAGFVDPSNPQAAGKVLAADMLRVERGKSALDTREKVSKAVAGLRPVDDDEVERGCLRQWDVQLLLDPGKTQTGRGGACWKTVRGLNEVTRKTLRGYVRAVRGEKKDEFGRVTFGHWRLGIVDGGVDVVDHDAEVCIGRMTPVAHFTIERCRLQRAGARLWGSGEIIGGLHRDNRLGCSSLLECVMFEGVAGEQAALVGTQMHS